MVAAPRGTTTMQCLEGVKHLCGVLLSCFDIDLKQPRGLEDPQLLARETVCMSHPTKFSFYRRLRTVVLLVQASTYCVLLVLSLCDVIMAALRVVCLCLQLA